MKHAFGLILLISLLIPSLTRADSPVALKPYAWTVIQPLGLREAAKIDSTFLDYSLRSVPSNVSPAWATTGNLGAPGIDMVFYQRKPMTEFIFADNLWPWIPTKSKIMFYNTRAPMTILSYNFGGSTLNFQDRLQGIFSGNVNKRLQFGAIVDYLFSKGSYDNQATKNFTWGFNGSYIGEKFEVQFYQTHYNLSNRENGGIESDLYITDPAEIQGGDPSVEPKSIPTNLTQAQNRTKGSSIFLNAKYKLGFWREVMLEDSSIVDDYVPVTSFAWTLDYQDGKHTFRNANTTQDIEFWENRYISTDGTDDNTSYSSLKNTFGISLLEGFNKYAKFGLAAYASFDLRKYNQTADSILYLPYDERPDGVTDYSGTLPVSKETEGLLSIGAQLTKQNGSILKYAATFELGITGRTAGDINVDGYVTTDFPFLKDTLSIKAFGEFHNQAPSYFTEHYISNHFIWENDFNKTRRLKVGGEVSFPRTWTTIHGEIENLNNYIYFDGLSMPVQASSSVQVISLSLRQNLQWRALHWDNELILQKSSDHSVIPIPKFIYYTNLYCQFKIAKVLDLQIGADLDYYAKHIAMAYQPATMQFYIDPTNEVGGFPFTNLYANMKLGKTRFYVMFSHINNGLFGKPNYFSVPHYPLNPRRFQLGLSIEFNN